MEQKILFISNLATRKAPFDVYAEYEETNVLYEIGNTDAEETTEQKL